VAIWDAVVINDLNDASISGYIDCNNVVRAGVETVLI
jgi:hypothetical protein